MNYNSTLIEKGDKTGFSHIHGKNISIKGGPKIYGAIREFSKYGLITFSRARVFKSTEYTMHFIKPVNKLKQLYNLGDEVLILCCNDNFTQFKSRTKDFIDFLLATKSEFRNRLDKVTCFLIDNNDDITKLVQKDRIDNPDSRLIVPFSYTEVLNGLTDDLLQSRLRIFVYERDLFGIATPLQNDNMFYGKDRTNIISDLFGKYRQGEHGGLFGLRRIGKTSILNILKQRVNQSNGVAIYYDCTKYHHLRWYEFLKQMLVDLKKDFITDSTDSVYLFDTKDYDDKTAPIDFEKDLSALYSDLKEQRILFIFDEIEQITYSTSSTNHWRKQNDSLFFWETLRSIHQTNSKLFSYVITGVNPKCIEENNINGTPNPIFGALTPKYIPLFDYKDIKTMVSSIGGHVGLSFEEEIYAKLVEDYGGHPFLTRQVCSKINTELLDAKQDRPCTITKNMYDKRSNEFRIQMESVITQILDVLSTYYPNEYELLKSLALDLELSRNVQSENTQNLG